MLKSVATFSQKFHHKKEVMKTTHGYGSGVMVSVAPDPASSRDPFNQKPSLSLVKNIDWWDIQTPAESKKLSKRQNNIKKMLSHLDDGNHDICENCRLILHECSWYMRDGKSRDDFSTDTSFQTVEQFAKAEFEWSCRLCRLIIACLPAEECEAYPELISLSVERDEDNTQGLWKLSMTKGPWALYPSFYLLPISEDPTDFSYWTPDGSTFDCASRWLEQCINGHPCCEKSDRSFVPTRLLDVGSNADDVPRLVEPRTAVTYLTLSHRWGEFMPFKLLQGNVEEMKVGIPMSKLSKTFQDAVATTRHLKVRYLWIDSLCIIQDSNEDWGRESQLMCKIYSSSLCNLAGTAGTDGSYGLFFDRTDQHASEILSQFQVGGKPYRIIDTAHWHNTVEEQPLFERGWVFQERRLAPRNLYFGENELAWECARHCLTEVYPHSLPSRENRLEHVMRMTPWLEQTAREDLASNPSQIQSLKDQWELVVHTYSKGALTYPTDKLVAISGIAEKFRDLLQDEYMAGLWKQNLRNELLWYIRPGAPSRSKEYIAPSWSWASLDGQIQFRRAPTDCKVVTEFVTEVTDTQLNLITTNPLGQLKGGSITLRGPLCPAIVHLNPEVPHCDCCDSVDGYEFQYEFPGSAYSRKHHPNVRFHPDITLQGKLGTIGRLFCLPIRMDHLTWGEELEPKSLTQITGLVLQAAEGRKGEFLRWGLCLMAVNSSQGDPKPPVWDSHSENHQEDNDGEPDFGGKFGRLSPAFERFDQGRQERGVNFFEDGEGGFIYDVKII